MKKFVIIMLIAVVASSAIFAADIQVGVMQNLVNTSVLLDAEFEHFGVETAVGFPFVWYAGSVIDALAHSGSDSQTGSGAVARGESEETEESGGSSFALVTGAMANVYWKVFTGNRFGFRLGIQTDAIGLFASDATRIMGSFGASFGFNFKFTDTFSMNFTATPPFGWLLSPLGEAVTQYTVFYYNNANADNLGEALGEVFLAILQAIGVYGNQLARLSFKWSV